MAMRLQLGTLFWKHQVNIIEIQIGDFLCIFVLNKSQWRLTVFFLWCDHDMEIQAFSPEVMWFRCWCSPKPSTYYIIVKNVPGVNHATTSSNHLVSKLLHPILNNFIPLQSESFFTFQQIQISSNHSGQWERPTCDVDRQRRLGPARAARAAAHLGCRGGGGRGAPSALDRAEGCRRRAAVVRFLEMLSEWLQVHEQQSQVGGWRYRGLKGSLSFMNIWGWDTVQTRDFLGTFCIFMATYSMIS